MSRIGKQSIDVPKDVTVSLGEREIMVKGPKGELSITVRPEIIFKKEESQLILTPKDDKNFTKALWGTYRSILQNMIEGVLKGFEKRLILEGVGYKAQMKGKDLELLLGFAHPVIVTPKDGIEFKVEKNAIIVSGISKELVGNAAASVRALKKPEPYKGKGIRYENEVVRRKAGKKAIGTTT
ncbi:50S ribosomal protein L6 [Patescibacteria group bacterium]